MDRLRGAAAGSAFASLPDRPLRDKQEMSRRPGKALGADQAVRSSLKESAKNSDRTNASRSCAQQSRKNDGKCFVERARRRRIFQSAAIKLGRSRRAIYVCKQRQEIW